MVIPGSPEEVFSEKTDQNRTPLPEINSRNYKKIEKRELLFMSLFGINPHSAVEIEDVRIVISACAFAFEMNYLNLREIVIVEASP
jgi:hypothetical protein